MQFQGKGKGGGATFPVTMTRTEIKDGSVPRHSFIRSVVKNFFFWEGRWASENPGHVMCFYFTAHACTHIHTRKPPTPEDKKYEQTTGDCSLSKCGPGLDDVSLSSYVFFQHKKNFFIVLNLGEVPAFGDGTIVCLVPPSS